MSLIPPRYQTTPSPLEVKANALRAFVRGGGGDCAAIAGAAPCGLTSAPGEGREGGETRPAVSP